MEWGRKCIGPRSLEARTILYSLRARGAKLHLYWLLIRGAPIVKKICDSRWEMCYTTGRLRTARQRVSTGDNAD